MCSSVEDWLRSLGLIHYTQAFLDNGYDELEICKEIGREDLDAIGVTNFKDRTDILNDVERLKQSGTAVYFVLEGTDNSAGSQNVQPDREKYAPVKLKMMLHDKLEEDKVNLAGPPYTRPDGSLGNLDPLITVYADKFYTYEDDVRTALLNLRQRQARSSSVCEDISPQTARPAASVPSNPVRHRHSTEDEGQSTERHSEASEDEGQQISRTKQEKRSPHIVGTHLPDYLDVDSPGNRGKKEKDKKRRKVQRNTKLSRSLDSLKELHVNNLEVKPRGRESASFKTKSFGLKWFSGSKKKHSGGEYKKQNLEKKLSGQAKKDYELLASAIKMSEEDRKTLMIMVKQGDLTVEEAVEQLKRYEEDCRPKEDSSPKGDLSNEEDKTGGKPKLKRGIFGKSTKRKSVSRPASEFVACEMTMSEQDRIDLMVRVKNGDMSVDQALKRFISYEEKHKKSDPDDSAKPSHYVKESPKLPKQSGFSRISIKRVSGVLSSSFKVSSHANEANSVFYTAEDNGSVDGSVSSGDEVLGTADSSPAPSPKRLLSGIQGPNKSQHSSTSSMESVEKAEGKSEASPSEKKAPSFLSEMKMTLSNQNRAVLRNIGGRQAGVTAVSVSQEFKDVPVCGKHERVPPPKPDRKRSLPTLESEKVVVPTFTTGSLKRIPPSVPPRNVAEVSVLHRPAPPIPLRPKPASTEERSESSAVGIAETTILSMDREVRSSDDEIERGPGETNARHSNDGKYDSPVGRSLSEGHTKEMKPGTESVAAQKPRHKPPPLPPRPPSSGSSSSSLNDEAHVTEARSVETQTSPPWGKSPVRKAPTEAIPREDGSKAPQGTSSSKPQIKPKPKPKPRIKPAVTEDKDNVVYHKVPQPRLVDEASTEVPYHALPKPHLVDSASASVPYHALPTPHQNDEASDGDQYCEVPPPRPVEETHSAGQYHAVPLPRPVEGSRTHGEVSENGENGNFEMETRSPSHPPKPGRRTVRQRSEGGEVTSRLKPSPVPAPRVKRASHSLGEMVERRLHIEKIDLTGEPYSDQSGCWNVPVNLVDRYAEELHRSHEELAGIMDKIRVRKLKQVGRTAVPCDVTQLDFTRDPLGQLESLSEWLTSLGLPMYITSLGEVEYDDMEVMPYMEERHFQYAGISDPRHMKRLLESVAEMPRVPR